MTDLIYLGVAGAAAHFLLYRALVTRWLWSRYPAKLDAFFSCSACTGFWVGLGIGQAWWYWDVPALGLPAGCPIIAPAAAVAAMVVSPIAAYVQVVALDHLGTPEHNAPEEE